MRSILFCLTIAAVWQLTGAAETLTPERAVKTPTLIVHDEDDLTNPVAQAKALFRALKRVGVETELVTYPGELHLPQQEQHQVDIMKRMLDWFDRHLK